MRAIVDLLNPELPVWDLCCDHGHLGWATLERYPLAQVVFVDRARETVSALERSTRRYSRMAGRYRIVCADIMQMELPPAPVNFIVAGVSVNVMCEFVDRVGSRRGDRIICNTFQNASGFEARAARCGFAVAHSLEVPTRSGRQYLWVLLSRDREYRIG